MTKLNEFAQNVVNTLIEKNISIASAESMTGGYFAKTFTDVPGASKVFDRSIVTYTKSAKSDELGLSLKDIEEYGVVSERTAKGMALGVLLKTNVDIAISITGVAGPGPDEDVPAGTFYVGIAYKNVCFAKKFEFGDLGRDEIREKAVFTMFDIIKSLII